MTLSLSVVIPVHNEAEHLPRTIDALVEAIEQSDFEAELVLVDDGSTDRSAEVVRSTVSRRLPLTVLEQPNSGRFAARRSGLEAAKGDWVLLLDARVRLERTSLESVCKVLTERERVWNGHVQVETEGNPYGAFWDVLAKLAWREYFDHPRRASFASENFDHYPKGTGCFLAPREALLDAIAAFDSYYSNQRFVSDDTGLIRWLAERERIHITPEFACRYSPRTTLRSFLRQAVYRGSTFVDGHARPESRFFLPAVAFFPISVTLALLALRRPTIVPALAAATAVAAGGLAAAGGHPRFESVSFGLLAPVYAVAHGAGMWRGGLMLLVERARGRYRRAVSTISRSRVSTASATSDHGRVDTIGRSSKSR